MTDPTPPAPGWSRRGVLGATAAAVAGAGLLALGADKVFASDDAAGRRFGISVGAAPADAIAAATAIGAQVGRNPTIVNTYAAWQWQAPFPVGFVREAAAAGIEPQITWEPWDPRRTADQPRYRLTDLDAYDSYLDSFASTAGALALPLNLRVAHEMNGWWYPWAVGQNGNTAADYVTAWRRIHDRTVAAGADKVSWTWSVNAVDAALPGTRPVDVTRCYPGDDVVDVISLDAFDREGTLTPEQLLAPSIEKLSALAPGKPLWVNEIGTARTTGQADWVHGCIDYLRGTRASALLWFEIAAPGQPDYRLSAPDTVATARASLHGW
ncbi:MAG: beta-mannanase [Marmoricola sp.]|nr:beta-mannanase [Marmoricola sp.]